MLFSFGEFSEDSCRAVYTLLTTVNEMTYRLYREAVISYVASKESVYRVILLV
jgi:hypothetical protein